MAVWILSPRSGTCCTCRPTVCDNCNCPSISSVECRTKSASVSKCGFEEFTSPSTPPKIYAIKTQSGTVSNIPGFCGINSCESITDTWSGNITYTKSTCSTSDSRALRIQNALTGLCGSCTGDSSFSINADDQTLAIGEYNGLQVVTFGFGCTGIAVSVISCGGSGTTITQTQITMSMDTACGTCATGTVTVTLSDEYTTAELETNGEAALAAASWSSYGTCSGVYAINHLTTDEIINTLRDVGWRFNFSFVTGTGCKLDFDIMDSGGVHSHVCIDLSSGISLYDYTLTHPSVGGDDLTIANWVVTEGAC